MTDDPIDWRAKYESTFIPAAILDEATSEGAYSLDQLVAILARHGRVVESYGDDGKPTGGCEIRVKFPSRDKDGKPLTLDLTPLEAVRSLTEDPAHACLFVDPASLARPTQSIVDFMAERRRQRGQ